MLQRAKRRYHRDPNDNSIIAATIHLVFFFNVHTKRDQKITAIFTCSTEYSFIRLH